MSDDVEELVHRSRQGEAQAFTHLVKRYQNAAYATAMGVLRDRDDAQDAVQDAFIACFCRLGQLRDDKRFGGWLQSIVRSHSHDFLRRRSKARSRHVKLDAGDSALLNRAWESHRQGQLRGDLWDSVNELPEQFATVVLLHYMAGLSYEEMAEYLGVPVSTVRGRLQQSRIRLRNAMTTQDLKKMERTRMDVSSQVEAIVCQIVTEPIALQLPVQEQVVLFCGVDTNVEVARCATTELEISGTKVSLGLSADAAEESLKGIELLADDVADYVASGPHAGEVFAGTTDGRHGPVAMTETTQELWRAWMEGPGVDLLGVDAALFPGLTEAGGSEEIALTPGAATRISLLRRKVEDIILPVASLTPEVRRVFHANNTSEDQAHGPLGFANLTLGLPEGTSLTILRGRGVSVRGMTGDLTIAYSRAQQVLDVEGRVTLLDTPIEELRRVTGDVSLRITGHGGTSYDLDMAKRGASYRTCLDQVHGNVDIAVERVELELSGIDGPATIRNRFGATNMHLHAAVQGRTILSSSSGPIDLHVEPDLLAEIRLAVATLCGSIDYSNLGTEEKSTANTHQIQLLTTPPHGGDWNRTLTEADVLIRSEAGPVTLRAAR
jgi:RNA polymerase sigma-70 factor, ECF subfamily